MANEMPPPPSPFIYWGQSSKNISIKIALKDVQLEPNVELANDKIGFEGSGIGAHGDCLYKFCIKPYKPIAPEKSRMRVTGSEVLIDIPKREETTKENPWPRLTKDSSKHAWIKPDFDKMDISDDEDEQLKERKRLEKEYIDKLTGEIQDTQDQAMADLRRNYLFSYSLFQVIAFSFIAVRLCLGMATVQNYKAFNDIGTVLIICQLFSFLEVVHPLVGLVKTSFIPPLMQTCGRNLVLLVVIWNEPQLQDTEVAAYLFLFWSLADIIRHPFYMLSSMKLSVYWLTWLRYTMWILLYPLGAGCEWLITWRAIPLFEKSGKFSLELPNMFNFGFSLTTYLYIHLLVLPLGLAKLMLHMASMRRKKLGGAKNSLDKSKKTN